MKKILAMLASVVMASTMIATTAFAEKAADDYWTLVNTKEVTELNEGEEIELNLQALLAKKAIGEMVLVYFDKDAFECVSVEDVDGNPCTSEDAAFTLSATVAFSGNINNDEGVVSFSYANLQGTNKSMKANDEFAYITFKAKEVVEDTQAAFTVWHQASGENASKGDIDSATVTVTVKAAAVEPPVDEKDKGTAGNEFEGKATKYWTVDFAEWTGAADVSLTDGTTTKTINVTTADDSEYDIAGAVSFYVYVIGDAAAIENVYIVE